LIRTPVIFTFFWGRRGDLIKIIWHDGQGACLLPSFRLDGSRRAGCARSLPGRLCRFVRGNLFGGPADAIVRHPDLLAGKLA
jgi:hypothetical protein